MKLSEIKGARTFDVIADIIDPISAIATDKQAMELFKRQKIPKGMDEKTFVLQRVRDHVPYLLHEHKGDVISIMAAIEGVTAEEYAASLDLGKLMADLYDLLTDDGIIPLFTRARSQVSSGSAPETTEAH